jgi:uncharacterized protein DUF1559
MTIRFACECGQTLAAAEENAGKRVKCTSCGGIQTVPPVSRPRPTVATPTPTAITTGQAAPLRFECDCGQTCQARPEHAGKKTKCPNCGKLLTIPSPDEANEEELEEPRPRRAASITADRPAARSGRRASFDNEEEDERPRRRARDEEDEEDRPRKRKKGGAKKWIFIGAGVAAVAGIAVLLWLLLGGGISSDFDLVPRDAQGFVTVRVADLLDTPAGKKLMGKAGDAEKQLKEFEDKAGLSLKDVERVTLVVADADKKLIWGIVQTSKAIDKDKILEAIGKPPEKNHAGKTYYGKNDGAVAFLGPKLAVVGSEDGVKACLEMKKPGSGPLSDALKLASKKKYQIAGGVNVTAALAGQLQKGGRNAGPFKDLLEVKAASFGIAVKDDLQLDFSAEFPDKDKAKSVASTINDKFVKEAKSKGGDIFKNLTDAKQSGKSVEINWKFDKSVVDEADKLVAMLLGPSVAKVRQAAGAAEASNNFKQLALAFLIASDSNQGRFPQAAIYSKNGQPLLSWRVAILPYIEQGDLYRQFKLDEPWNSPHNLRLVSKMPKTFQIAGAFAPAGRTYIQVFTGPNTPFPGAMQKLRFPASFLDGSSNTVLLAEAASAVVWTAPDDMNTAFRAPKLLVGNHTGKGPLVAMADGSVRFVSPRVSDKTWKAVVSPAGNDMPGPDW